MSLASENGDGVVTIKGSGFNLAGLDWVDFGDPSQYASQDFNLVTVTGTEIQIAPPPLETLTVDPLTVPVTVQSLSGNSVSIDATYAGVPAVTGVTATGGPTAGKSAGPDTGGTPIDVTGAGLADQVVVVGFVDALGPFSLGTQYNFTAHSESDLTSTTVPQNPALVDVEVCTVTSCSLPMPSEDPGDLFLLYPPGDPKVDSITPASGSSSGGTLVTITGENLGCVTGVFFGNVAATKVSNAAALLDCGSTTQVTVTAPPGKTGRSVPVTVTTLEGDLTGFGPSTGTALFKYTHALVLTLTVRDVGNGYGTVKSSPAGISCAKASCAHRFPYGSAVKLTAKPADGSRFAGWAGACKGTGKCTVRLKSARVVKARFVKSSR